MGLNYLLMLLLLGFSSFSLEASSSLSYSGRLANTDGSPVTGPVDLKFELAYTNSSGIGPVLCDQLIEGVPLTNGVFHVKLNFTCPSSSIVKVLSSTPDGESAAIRVTNENSGKAYPYQALHSLPFSQVSKQLTQMGATNGQVLTWNGAEWAPANGATTDGTVKNIQTGSGLMGGPITDSGTIYIAPGGVLDSHLSIGIDPAKLGGARDSSKYLKGDNTWSSFGDDVLATILTGFSTASSAVVTATDSILEALGKTQAQLTNKIDKTGGTLSVGTIDGVPTPVLPSQVVNKQYVDDAIGGVNTSQWTDDANGIHYTTGKVGIGVILPTTDLHVANGVSAPIIALDNTKGSADESAILKFKKNGNDQWGIMTDPGQSGEQSLVMWDYVSGAARLKIDSTGNIGMGTTTPGAKLEVAGQVKITGGTPGAGKVLTSDASGLATWTDPVSTAPTGAAGGDLSGTYPDPTIANGVITDAKIAAGANIDQSKIAGLTTDLGNKQATDSDLTALAGLGTTGVLVRTGTGTATTRSIVGTANRVSVTNGDGVSGDPTINVSSTLLPSPVAGDAGKFLKATGADTASWGTFLSTDITTALGFTPINKAGDSITSGIFDYSGTSFVRVQDPVAATDAANKQYVDDKLTSGSNQWSESGGNVYRSTGNVGIGTTSPGVKLDILNSTGASQLALRKTTADSAYLTGGTAGMSLSTNAKYNGTNWIAEGTTASNIFLSSTGFIDFDVDTGLTVGQTFSPSQKMRITSSGNIGIGTTNPQNQFHIANGSNATVRLDSGAGLASGILHYNGATAGSGLAFFPAADSRAFAVLGSDLINTNAKLTVLQNGNVGIGTIAPVIKLDVAGAVRVGTDATACSATIAGAIRYSAGSVQYCNGTAWTAFAASGAGITSVNGLTAGTQTFAIGTAGSAPAFNSATSTHTLNIPMASAAGVTAGLLSKTDYDAFNNKLGTTLNSGNIWVGNGSNVATAVTPSSDVSMTNAGAFTVTKLQGRAVSTTAPNLGSFLKWDNLLSQWAPSAFTTCAGTSEVMHYNSLTDTWSCDTIGIDNLLPTQTANSGKVLTTNGTTASWQTPATGVGGSGTTNYVPKFTAASTLGDSLIFDNGTNVGIGTATPATKLDVNGTSTFRDTVNIAFMKDIVFNAGKISSVSQIGISTIPAYQLDISSNTADLYTSTSAVVPVPTSYSGIRAYNTSATTGSGSFVVLEAKNATSTRQSAYLGTISEAAGSSPSIVIGQKTGAAAYAERLRIDSSGNVGIGTTAPARILHVNGPMRLTPSTTPASPAAGDIFIDSAASNMLKFYNGSSWASASGASNIDELSDGITTASSLYIGASVGAATTGGQNTAVGIQALQATGNGGWNSAFGNRALNANTSGSQNNAFGYQALQSNTTGIGNNAFGKDALRDNSTGTGNTVVGDEAFRTNTSGFANSVFGYAAAVSGVGTRNYSTIMGAFSGTTITGDKNIIIGANSGNDPTNTGRDSNILIGYNVEVPAANTDNYLNIGNTIYGNTSLGNVGIGTTTPGAKLEVAGQVKITGGTPGVGKVLTSDASGLATWETAAAGGVTSLNGLSGDTQTFATPGTSGTAPAWSSSGTAHTLNIPMASAAGVTAGLLSKTDYDSFNNKLATTLNSGNIWVGNGSNVATAVTPSSDVSMTNAGAFTVTKLQGRAVSTTAPGLGSFLKWNNTLSNWEPFLFSNCNGTTEVLRYTLLTDTWTCDTLGINNLLPTQTANSGKVLTTDGTTASWQAPSAPPAGASTQIQYNSSGVMGASSNLVWFNGSAQLAIGYGGSGTSAAGSRFTVEKTYSPSAGGSGTSTLGSVDFKFWPTVAHSVQGGALKGSFTSLGSQNMSGTGFGGVDGNYRHNSTGAMTGTAYGVQGMVSGAANNGNLTGKSIGVQGKIYGGFGSGLPSFTEALGVQSSIDLTGSVTGGTAITTAVGFQAEANTAAFDTISTLIGLRVKAPTGAGTVTNKYAIITEANAGNVGIGTTSPLAKMDVNGEIVTSSGGAVVGRMRSLNLETAPVYAFSGGNTGMWAPTTTSLGFSTDGVENMRITQNGSVGIKTTTPSATLDVNGVATMNASTETVTTYVNTATAYTIPDSLTNIRRLTLTGNATITLPSFTSATPKVFTLTVFLKQDATGSRTMSFIGSGADTVKWDSGTAPSIATTANKITIVQFTKPSDETVWYASKVWQE